MFLFVVILHLVTRTISNQFSFFLRVREFITEFVDVFSWVSAGQNAKKKIDKKNCEKASEKKN